MRGSLSAFAEGLSDWIAHDDSDESFAAATLLAETILLARRWLELQFKAPKD